MHIMILQAAKPNGMYVYKSLPLVSFMQVVRKAGSEEKLKAVFHSRSLHCFCFVFLSSKAKQSMHQYNPHAFIERMIWKPMQVAVID